MDINTIQTRINALKARVVEAEGRDISDSAFARRFLPFSASTLSRIMAGEYGGAKGGNLTRIAEHLDTAEADIDGRLDGLRKAAETDVQFVRTRLASAALASVAKARDSRDRRVVVILAPTGAGKTAIGRYLQQRGAVYVEGRQSWRSSYKAFCADVAAAAGHPLKVRAFTERDAEARMLHALGIKDGVLYIDEANTLGASTANAIKLIANQTGYTVVIGAIPEMWDKFHAGSQDEVRQVINRCQPVLRHTHLTPGDCKPFLARAGLPEADLAKAVPLVCDAANAFGAIKTVMALAADLADLGRPALDDVTKALGIHRQNTTGAGIVEAD